MSLVDMALSYHRTAFLNQETREWRNVERALMRRKELFHAVKLRSKSCQSRMLNVVNLVRCLSILLSSIQYILSPNLLFVGGRKLTIWHCRHLTSKPDAKPSSPSAMAEQCASSLSLP
jgi:hypothetical protein